MKRIVIASLLLLASVSAPGIAPGVLAGGLQSIQLQLLDWQTVRGIVPCVRVRARFYNPEASAASEPATGRMLAQPFGAFLANGPEVGTFDVPAMEPGSFFDVFVDIPMTDLPPSAARIIPGSPTGGSAPASACPEDDFWAGNIDVLWTSPGGNGQVNVHNGTLQICPGASASYIHVIMDCRSAGGINWSFDPLCTGWTASLVQNTNGQPGDPVTGPIPAGFFDGWICIAATSSVTVGSTCNLVMNLECDGKAATISVLADACDWQAVPVEPSTWSGVKVQFGR